jgi:putative endonuclease
MFCTYILYSEKQQQYYCGQSNNLFYRLTQHNSGETLSIKHGISWNLAGYLECKPRSECILLERQIKKRGIERWLQSHGDKKALGSTVQRFL